MLWLGKAIHDGAESQSKYFHMGTSEEPPNSARPVLNRALWKMLADHAHHTFRVVTDQDPEYKTLEAYVEVGGDEDRDMDFEAYLTGWPG
jgi:hypothetical protein